MRANAASATGSADRAHAAASTAASGNIHIFFMRSPFSLELLLNAERSYRKVAVPAVPVRREYRLEQQDLPSVVALQATTKAVTRYRWRRCACHRLLP